MAISNDIGDDYKAIKNRRRDIKPFLAWLVPSILLANP